MNPLKPIIGIFGGTFDPIHFGHLRSALEIHEQLKLPEIRFMPCQHPPHRPSPIASAEDRVNMIRLGLMNSPLLLDTREMNREGPSYSVESLQTLRLDYPKASLCMIIGSDAFLKLPTWHEWEKLMPLANIIVMHRSGWKLPKTGVIAKILEEHQLHPHEHLRDFTAGKIVQHKITALDISGSQIRSLIQTGRSPQFLLPKNVWEYIQQHRLYGYPGNPSLTEPLEKTKL